MNLNYMNLKWLKLTTRIYEMKMRLGFVTNSSSSCYIIGSKEELKRSELREDLVKFFKSHKKELKRKPEEAARILISSMDNEEIPKEDIFDDYDQRPKLKPKCDQIREENLNWFEWVEVEHNGSGNEDDLKQILDSVYDEDTSKIHKLSDRVFLI